MEKQTKMSFLALGLYIVSTLLHNLYYVLTGVEEIPLFAVALVSIVLFLFSLLFNVFTYLRKGKPKDIHKLGWLGLFGLLGFMPGFGAGFFGLYGFYGFFGFKSKK